MRYTVLSLFVLVSLTWAAPVLADPMPMTESQAFTLMGQTTATYNPETGVVAFNGVIQYPLAQLQVEMLGNQTFYFQNGSTLPFASSNSGSANLNLSPGQAQSAYSAALASVGGIPGGGAGDGIPGGGAGDGIPGGGVSTDPPDNCDGGSGTRLCNPLISDTIVAFIQAIINVMLVFAVPFVVFFIIYAGFLYVTARGNAEQVKKAHYALLYSLIGGLLIIGATVLIDIVANTVTEVTGREIPR